MRTSLRAYTYIVEPLFAGPIALPRAPWPVIPKSCAFDVPSRGRRVLTATWSR